MESYDIHDIHFKLCEESKNIILSSGFVVYTHFLFGQTVGVVQTPITCKAEHLAMWAAMKQMVKDQGVSVYSSVMEATLYVADKGQVTVNDIEQMTDEMVADVKANGRKMDVMVVMTQDRGGGCLMTSFEVIRNSEGKVVDIVHVSDDAAIKGPDKFTSVFDLEVEDDSAEPEN